jgi:predicted MPP superfamily phosphohydrolase
MSFLVMVIVVLSLMYGYIGWRIIVPAALGFPINLILWLLIAISFVLLFAPFVLRANGVEGLPVDIIAWAAYLTFGFFTLLFAFLVAKDILFLLNAGIQKASSLVRGYFDSAASAAGNVDPDRRRLLINSLNVGILFATGGLTGYGMFQALKKPAVITVDIPIKDLHPDLDGLTIVQITDIHVGPTIKRGFVQEVVDTVNGLNPDIIALTGDLVDGSVRQLQHDVAPLSELQAPLGYYFITGNHEYYSGVKQWVAETARLGFTVLLNEHRVIQRGEGRVLFAGVTDYSAGQFDPSQASDPQKAIDGAPDCHVKLLLAHQPKSIFKAAEVGYDYVISGHTHGGQYFPYHFLAALAQPYISGLHTHDRTRIYVSRGTGYWGPPLRIGAPSEITIHRLIKV